MGPLTIRLLGYPEITAGQQPLSFRTRKVLALLVHLAVEGGMHSRESLTALLWPESAPKNAAVTLRGTLARLRKSLEPAGQVLIATGGQVGLDPDQPIDLDLAWLAAAVHPDTSPEALNAILAFDRGEFLAGFSLPDAPGFDTWAATQREACQRLVETVYDRLSSHQLALQQSAPAVETAARWAARAPLSETAYRRLMAAQALAGDRPAALQTYDRCRAVLREEYGIDPARETALLADQIGRDRVRASLGDGPEGRAAPRVPVRQESGRLTLPFVGRDEEHSLLVDAFNLAGEAGAQVVALVGAAGVGKTSLVSAFLEWVALDSPGVELMGGRAFEMGGRLPYQPVIEALRVRLEQENAPEDLLEDVWMAELSQLIPELRARYPDLPSPMSGDANFVRSRIFEAVATLGNALAKRHPVVFTLDDMQWADGDTHALVKYLARRWSESAAPILLLLLVRQESFAADTRLREWLAQLERDAPVTRLLLDSLGGTSVAQLVTQLAGSTPDHETANAFAAWLWAETHGLPFFIEALLQMLVEEGVLPRTGEPGARFDFAAALQHVESVAEVPLPPGVRAVILARVERLSVPASAMLLAASVLGRETTFTRLCQVADLAESEALAALEALLDGRLLDERRASRRPYSLAHDYIRGVVYGESREARRRVFHRRALLALEAERAPAAECAFHALASMLDEPAFRFSLAAGKEAFQSYSLQESLAHYDRAREVARRMFEGGADIATPALLQLYQSRGRVLELLQNHEAARDNYQEMLSIATERQDQALEQAALTAQCIIHATYTSVFNPALAKEMGAAALALAKARNDRASEAAASWGLMLAELFSAGDSRTTMAYGEKALSLARELGLQELMGYVLTNLSWPYIAGKELAAAREANREAQAIWQELGDLPMLSEAGTMGLFIHYFAAEHEDLLAKASEALAVGRTVGSRLHQANALRFMADAHGPQGRIGEALANIQAALALSEDSGHAQSLQTDYRFLANIYRQAGALDQAEQWADTLYAMRETIMPTFRTVFLTDIARVKIARGKLEEGQAILAELLEGFAWETSWSHTIISISIAYGHLHLALDRPERVFDHFDERVQSFREAGFLYSLSEELWLKGMAWLALGEANRAREALLQAKGVAEEKAERAYLWQVLAALGEVEGASGAEAQAKKLRGQVREIIADIAHHAGSEELRAAFLAQPEVANILEPRIDRSGS